MPMQLARFIHLATAGLVLALAPACADDAPPVADDGTSTGGTSSTGDEPDSTAADSGSGTTAETDTGTDTETEWTCQVTEGLATDYSHQLGCEDDFAALSSLPLDASIAGARSIKTVIDRSDSDALYFTNSRCYPIHWDFASVFLSGNGLPPVPDLGTFNSIE